MTEEDAVPPAEDAAPPPAEDVALPTAEDYAKPYGNYKELEGRSCNPPTPSALRDAPPPPPEDDEPSTEAAAAAEESPLRAIRSACSDLQAQLGAMIASFDDLDAAPLTLSL